MEKRVYSVEWLSESSHRNATYPSLDLSTCRTGTSTLPFHKEFTTQGMDRPSTTNGSNEKENHIDHTAALYPIQRPQTEAHDVTISRKAFKEVHFGKPRSNQHQNMETDCAKSPGSQSEDDSMSRPRTKFTKEQLQELEKSFKEHRYIGSNEKKRLSKVLKLSETQIKTWFQNRRMKFKRQSQDARVEAFFSGLYVPYCGYTDYQTPACSVGSGLAMPLAPSAPTHPFAPLPATGIRPGHLPLSIPPANLNSYSYPPVLVQPSLQESVGLRYSPY